MIDFPPVHESSPKRKYGPTPVITNPDKLHMFDLVARIVKAAEGSALSSPFLNYVKPFLDLFCSRQQLDAMEGLILAIIIDNTVEGGTSYRDVGRFLHCTHIDVLKLLPVFKSLNEKRLIEVSRDFGRHMDYEPVEDLIKAYRDNKPYFPPSLKADNDEGLLTSVFDLNFSISQNNLSRDDYESKMENVMAANKDLPIMRHVNGYNLPDAGYNAVVLHLCCLLYFDNERDHDLRSMAFIFDEGSGRNHFIHLMKKGNGPLFKKGIVQFASTKDGLVDTSEFRLTDNAVHNLLPGYKPKGMSAMRLASVIMPEKIVEKKLFYSEDVQEQVARLAGLLDKRNFTEVQKRLVENNFRKGFCCLFYGGPGTGKTALAQELARSTGRKLVRIDLSSVRNMYVGQSEKNVQAIFSGYMAMLANEEDAPILLLNEADGLLTKRNTKGTDGVDKMENTMQNLLLQNMEEFEGIMIATTNLVSNMDKAFERRFLYKIKFPQPDAGVRGEIWHSMMPELSASAVSELAQKYPFSGGQIENIARKSIVDSILYGIDEAKKLDNIDGYCRHELIGRKKAKRPIGFNAYNI